MTSRSLNTYCDVTQCMNVLWIFITKHESPKGDSQTWSSPPRNNGACVIKPLRRRGFETPSRSLWRHGNALGQGVSNTCGCLFKTRLVTSLQWRHNERDSISDHQPHDYLLSRLFRRRSNKTSKLRTGLCAGNSPGNGIFVDMVALWGLVCVGHNRIRIDRFWQRVPPIRFVKLPETMSEIVHKCSKPNGIYTVFRQISGHCKMTPDIFRKANTMSCDIYDFLNVAVIQLVALLHVVKRTTM